MPIQGIDFEVNNYRITSEKRALQPEVIHDWLSTKSYWAKGIPLPKVLSSIAHSFCVGILQSGHQVGFARFITDYSTFGYLADVYVEEAHQKQGLAKIMCGAILDLSWVKGLRKITLGTRDAHGVYEALGFVVAQNPGRLMEIVRSDLYQ